LDADTFAQWSIVAAAVPVLAQQLDRAFVLRREPFEDLDRSRFSGAVWTKQTETLAGVDFEVESINRGNISESLYQRRAAQRDALTGNRRRSR